MLRTSRAPQHELTATRRPRGRLWPTGEHHPVNANDTEQYPSFALWFAGYLFDYQPTGDAACRGESALGPHEDDDIRE